jgi:hypothetical protein
MERKEREVNKKGFSKKITFELKDKKKPAMSVLQEGSRKK